MNGTDAITDSLSSPTKTYCCTHPKMLSQYINILSQNLKERKQSNGNSLFKRKNIYRKINELCEDKKNINEKASAYLYTYIFVSSCL